MSRNLYDAGAVLMPQGTYNSAQSFAPFAINPRALATSAVAINLQAAPVASATFTVEVASCEAGVYKPVGSLVWPAGVAGSKQVALGVNSSLAETLNNTSAWMRLSLATTGALTGSAWLTKPTSGGPGLASRSYTLDGVNQL